MRWHLSIGCRFGHESPLEEPLTVAMPKAKNEPRAWKVRPDTIHWLLTLQVENSLFFPRSLSVGRVASTRRLRSTCMLHSGSYFGGRSVQQRLHLPPGSCTGLPCSHHAPP